MFHVELLSERNETGRHQQMRRASWSTMRGAAASHPTPDGRRSDGQTRFSMKVAGLIVDHLHLLGWASRSAMTAGVFGSSRARLGHGLRELCGQCLDGLGILAPWCVLEPP